jgi:hypothetical protein
MFKNGEFDGFGRYEDLNVHIIYEGNFVEGRRDGFGKEYGSNSEYSSYEYEGYWSKGMKHGKGKQKVKCVNSSNFDLIDGLWANNELSETFQELSGSKQKMREHQQNSLSKILVKIQDDHLKQ